MSISDKLPQTISSPLQAASASPPPPVAAELAGLPGRNTDQLSLDAAPPSLDLNATLMAYPVKLPELPAPGLPKVTVKPAEAPKPHGFKHLLGLAGGTLERTAVDVASTGDLGTLNRPLANPMGTAQVVANAARQTASKQAKPAPELKAEGEHPHGFKHAVGKLGSAIGLTVADVGVGAASAIKDTATDDVASIVALSTHPKTTFANMGSALRHPIRTIKFMGHDDNELDPTAKADEPGKQPEPKPEESARRRISRHIGHVGAEFGLGWVTAGVAPVGKAFDVLGKVNTYADPLATVPDADDAETWDGKHDAKDPGITWKGVFKGAGKEAGGELVGDVAGTVHAVTHAKETAQRLEAAAKNPLDVANRLDAAKAAAKHHRDSGQDFGRGLVKIAQSTVGIPLPGPLWGRAQNVAGKGKVVDDLAVAAGMLAHGEPDDKDKAKDKNDDDDKT